MYLTWLDSNSWLIEIANKRILLDPWLVGSLTFGDTPWFFKADRRSPLPVSIYENIDLILLSQGLPDHAHPPTLKVLSRIIPIVGSPSAAKLTQELGYTNVTALAHDQVFSIPNLLEIHAVKGSPTGPTTTENGYILKDLGEGTSLYYEPHGYHTPTIQAFAPVDVVITPILDLRLPLLGTIIQGQQGALQVAKWLKPRIILPTAGDGDLIYSGFLLNFLKAEGSADMLRSQFQSHNLDTQILEVKVGERRQVSQTRNDAVASR
ncbi:putative Zn-dependent hydrolase of beta-lactamase fold protein [Synechococcus sp. PCC 7502]|uniref:MBL fold metallo-hydrolase n=1 Tax=Synechococcus sp. PCC 7502 TaxID=1173263 RepID=UPI00029FC654|nr:MBL fold metallo-hydrolase [Synechococcus sp. PCC 7502]AFY72727.1 putative Zn-dependent hydrolase of beta-lactamase fold protein [Synechococcus sp. PCC 7502]